MRKHHRNGLGAFVLDEKGATAVEYGLILALVFLAITAGVASLGTSVKGRWNDIANRVTSI